MQRQQTPQLESHDFQHEYSTPTKAKVQAVSEFNNAHGIFYFKSDVFRNFGVERSRGWAMLKDSSSDVFITIQTGRKREEERNS